MSNMLLNRLTVLFSVIAFILPKCTFLKITPGLLSPSSISLFHSLIYCCFKSCAQQLQYLESLVCFSYYLSCFLFIISQFFVWVGIWSSTMWRSNLRLWMLSSSSIQDLHLLWSGRQVHPGHLNTRSGISESSERSCSGTETNGFPVFLGGALLGPSLTHEEVTWVLATRGTWSLTPPRALCGHHRQCPASCLSAESSRTHRTSVGKAGSMLSFCSLILLLLFLSALLLPRSQDFKLSSPYVPVVFLLGQWVLRP